jgi:hypothetical protein
MKCGVCGIEIDLSEFTLEGNTFSKSGIGQNFTVTYAATGTCKCSKTKLIHLSVPYENKEDSVLPGFNKLGGQ